ncbi:MAG: phospho-sugar mutase, partial [Candidatus Sumerlaeia bacterium]|nr:phospho-sugar mutase [Candidatus Sumerlaeia bacterium]
REFAEETASVMAGNGIKACLFEDLRPTPELSFAVRHLKAIAGVVITASHNPKEYNGYKVYWSDGAQIVPPHDVKIIAEVRKIRSIREVRRLEFTAGVSKGMIKLLGTEIDEEFLSAIYKYAIIPDDSLKSGKELSIVYTPLHGAGIKLVPAALKKWGFTNVIVCEEQAQPDGNFPSVASPNPEEQTALLPAIDIARKYQGDILLANDPDCDRLGVVVRQHDGTYQILSGNQVLTLLGYFLLSQLKAQGRMPARPAVVTTIVSTRMLEAIARSFGVHTEYVLTGFKWICEKARVWENLPEDSPQRYDFLYGTEESLGYVIGTAVRDKDGVQAACAVAELALWAKIKKGKNLVEFLDELYQQYGVFIEDAHQSYRTGLEGQEQIKNMMDLLRQHPPQTIGGLEVEYITDVQQLQRFDRRSGRKIAEINLPSSNVLILELAGGNKIIARPSGTEPKIKFYFLFQDQEKLPIPTIEELSRRKKALRSKLLEVKNSFLTLLNCK